MALLKRISALLPTILIIIAVCMTPIVFSALNSSFHITNTGRIISPGIAASGSVSDIQYAIDWVIAAGGGTVYIPEGTFSFDADGDNNVEFSVPENGLQIIGAGKDKTILQMPVNDSAENTMMFKINGLSGGQVRISGISFRGRPNIETSPTGDYGILLKSCKDFRVDNCSFYYMGGIGVAVADSENTYSHTGSEVDQYVSQGLVDHCDFIDLFKPQATAQGRGYGYGVAVARAWHYLWTNFEETPWNTFGNYNLNTYIEDCYFTGCRHAVQSGGGGAYVLRHSTIEDHGTYAVVSTGHPVRQLVYGMFACEIYEVDVINNGKNLPTHNGFLVEGGSALIFNNTLTNIGGDPLLIGTSEYLNPEFYPSGDPHDIYVWNNQITGGSTTPTVYANVGSTPEEGVEFWTDMTGKYSTTDVENLVTSEGYEPYVYPHPLVSAFD